MTRTMNRPLAAIALGALLALGTEAPYASATVPYGSVTPGTPALGPGLAPPSIVPGKEYSHNRDSTTIGAVGSPPPPDAQQVIAWDGSGGAADGLDYTGTRPTYTPDNDVDALANHNDALFVHLLEDRSHLIFSVSITAHFAPAGPPPVVPAPAVVPSAGPLTLANGNVIGGAGEISYELGTAFGALPSTQGLWASQAAINLMPLPDDIDGLEVWGPEPGLTGDSNKYSLAVDSASFGVLPGDAVSVWNLSGTPYIAHSMIVSAVTSLLGDFPTAVNIGPQHVNLDALMVLDVVGSDDLFERDPTGGPGIDRIIFSITQIPNPLDPSGFYATGSELFVLDAAGTASFLTHGGHLWDKAYALANLRTAVAGTASIQLDINAIESITANVVPEPAAAFLLLMGLVPLATRRRR